MRIIRVTMLTAGTHIHRSQTMLTTGLIGHKRLLGDLVALRKSCSQSRILSRRGRLTEGHGRQVGGGT